MCWRANCIGAHAMSQALSDTVLLFLSTYIRSVEQLELLNLMQSSGPREWTAAEIAKSLYISPESALARLEEFAKQGVLKESNERFLYQPTDSTLSITIGHTLQAYKERRVAVINAIYSNPNENIKIFADAFKFKK